MKINLIIAIKWYAFDRYRHLIRDRMGTIKTNYLSIIEVSDKKKPDDSNNFLFYYCYHLNPSQLLNN